MNLRPVLALLPLVCACGAAAREVRVAAPAVRAAGFAEPVSKTAAAAEAEAGPYAELARAVTAPEASRGLGALLERLAAEPSNAGLREELGAFLLAHGEPALAIAPLQDAFYLRPGRMAAASLLAEAYVAAGRGSDALALAVRLVNERPEAAPRWLFRAEVERRIGDEAAAVESAGRCLLIDPASAAARAVLGFAYAELGNAALARDLLREAAAGDVPNRAAVEHRLGRLAQDAADWSTALDHLGRALAADPGYAAALNDRGVVNARLGRWREARADFDAAVRADPALAEAHVNLANLLIDEGAEPEALAALRSAARLGTDPAAFFVATGRLYALDVSTATGRGAALDYFRRARPLVSESDRAAIDRAVAKISGLPPAAVPRGTVEAVEVPAPVPAPAPARPDPARLPAAGAERYRPSVD